jgi:hypothetical protein
LRGRNTKKAKKKIMGCKKCFVCLSLFHSQNRAIL